VQVQHQIFTMNFKVTLSTGDKQCIYRSIFLTILLLEAFVCDVRIRFLLRFQVWDGLMASAQ
jgi:hypothetical protein